MTRRKRIYRQAIQSMGMAEEVRANQIVSDGAMLPLLPKYRRLIALATPTSTAPTYSEPLIPECSCAMPMAKTVRAKHTETDISIPNAIVA